MNRESVPGTIIDGTWNEGHVTIDAERVAEYVGSSPSKLPRQKNAVAELAFCDMRTLYLRNVPDEVGDRLAVLAAREGISVSAFAARELALIARRADNQALLAGLPDLGLDADRVVSDLDAGRSAR